MPPHERKHLSSHIDWNPSSSSRRIYQARSYRHAELWRVFHEHQSRTMSRALLTVAKVSDWQNDIHGRIATWRRCREACRVQTPTRSWISYPSYPTLTKLSHAILHVSMVSLTIHISLTLHSPPGSSPKEEVNVESPGRLRQSDRLTNSNSISWFFSRERALFDRDLLAICERESRYSSDVLGLSKIGQEQISCQTRCCYNRGQESLIFNMFLIQCLEESVQVKINVWTELDIPLENGIWHLTWQVLLFNVTG